MRLSDYDTQLRFNDEFVSMHDRSCCNQILARHLEWLPTGREPALYATVVGLSKGTTSATITMLRRSGFDSGAVLIYNYNSSTRIRHIDRICASTTTVIDTLKILRFHMEQNFPESHILSTLGAIESK